MKLCVSSDMVLRNARAKNVSKKTKLQLKVKFYDTLYLNPASYHVNNFRFRAIKASVRCLSLFVLY